MEWCGGEVCVCVEHVHELCGPIQAKMKRGSNKEEWACGSMEGVRAENGV